ncbi:zinc finger BED domain-containing protein RICESLEEPER [Trifolium repens]|nr:zinc finger BED domain-containing protein RICESLEEPER [Trifolium repens]
MEQGDERMARNASAMHRVVMQHHPNGIRKTYFDLYTLIVNDPLKDIYHSVSSVRNAVRFVKSSPHRAAKFKECIKIAGIECKKFVRLDVSTRWTSTYLMLDVAEKYQAAFDKLEDVDVSYRDFFDDDDSPPSNIDWENVRAFVKFLKHFNEAKKEALNGLVGSSIRSGEPSSSQSQSQPSGCA